MIKVGDGSFWSSTKAMLLPIMLPSQVFGFTFLYGYKRRSLRIIHRIVIVALLVLVFLHEVPSVLFWLRASEGLHRTLVMFETGSRWALFFMNYFLTTIYSSRVKAIIDDLLNYDLPDRVRAKVLKHHVVHLFVNVSVVVVYDILGHDYVWVNSNHNSLTSTSYIFNDLIILWSGFQFVQIANVAREFFKHINAKLEDFFTEPGSEVIRNEVIRLRHLHLYLYNICKRINSCYSVQLLCIMVFSVIQTTYAVRAFISDLIADANATTTKEAILNALWGFLYMFVVYQIVAVADYTSFESQRSSVMVHRLINNHFERRGLEKELEIFSLQIHQHQAVFSIWLFDLKFTLLNTLIGILTTYIIILITFQEEWKQGGLSGWNFKTDE